MTVQEYKIQVNLKYLELCNYLIIKYGKVPGNYFLTESCKSTNKKIKRGNEGLFVHHIAENEWAMLASPESARRADFKYQLAENLVYCDIVEHMLLHLKIFEEYASFEKPLIGLNGLTIYLWKQIQTLCQKEYYLHNPQSYNVDKLVPPWEKATIARIDHTALDLFLKHAKRVILSREDILSTLPSREYEVCVKNFIDSV